MYKTLVDCFIGYGLLDKTPEELGEIIDNDGNYATEGGLIRNSVILLNARMSDQNSSFRGTEDALKVLRRQLADFKARREKMVKAGETAKSYIFTTMETKENLKTLYGKELPDFVSKTWDDLSRIATEALSISGETEKTVKSLEKRISQTVDAISMREKSLEIQNRLVSVVNAGDRNKGELRNLKRSLLAFKDEVRQADSSEITLLNIKNVPESEKISDIDLYENPKYKDTDFARRNARNQDILSVDSVLRMVKEILKLGN